MQNTSRHLLEYNGIFLENDELYRGLAKAMGLPDCAFWILYALREKDGAVTQSQICSTVYMPKQTVNSALKKLAHDGYLVLNEQNDRRSKQICLTERGVRLAEATVDKVFAAEDRALAGLSEKERERFLFLFRRYTELLKESMRELKESGNTEKVR